MVESIDIIAWMITIDSVILIVCMLAISITILKLARKKPPEQQEQPNIDDLLPNNGKQVKDKFLKF